MGLFAKEEGASSAALGDAPKRMAWTRELGTRKLLFGFIAVLLVGWGYGKVRDHQLLAKHWDRLQPDAAGLNVIGTLNERDSVGRNLFHVVEASKTTRVLLTDFGWSKMVFNGELGPLFSEETGQAIEAALEVDNETGFKMLEPFLRARVAREMSDPRFAPPVSRETVVTVNEQGKPVRKTLGALLDQYEKKAHVGAAGGSSGDEGESLGEREVEHGKTMSGTTLVDVCPVVLTGRTFSDAWIDETDEPLLGEKIYKVHLALTPEGRSRFYQWSRDHVNQHLIFVLNGQVLTGGRVKMTLDVNEWEIGPLRSKETADALAGYVNGHKRS